MGKYAREPGNMEKSCKARGTDLRVHYKNTHETCMAIKGKGLEEAQKYLNAVIAGKRYDTETGRWRTLARVVVLGVGQRPTMRSRNKGIGDYEARERGMRWHVRSFFTCGAKRRRGVRRKRRDLGGVL